MSSEVALAVEDLGKCYQIYDKPRDRLLQMLARGRRRFYRDFWALRHVSFEVARGETVGIVGRNGSGKSTLLQLVCGTLNPSEGRVQANGRIAALLELGSGFNAEFSGRENVFLNAALLGLTAEETRERYDNICAFADIGDFIDQPVKTYSSGMVVRLAFAVAIHVQPEILVVDEALAVGDELFQRKCFSRIEQLRQSGTTILLVSHAGGTIVSLCDRAILLDGGELLCSGAPKSVIGRYQRLLYAPEDRRADIRAQILAGTLPLTPEKTVRPDTGGPRESEPAPAATEAGEFFDPGLQPQSTIAYESRGATIGAVQIRNLDGARVNCLVRGRTYKCLYRVRFDRSADQVRFGMLIKTPSGVELGGGVSAAGLADSIAYIGAGSEFDVEFRFNCSLNPGTYFLNAGVVGTGGEQEIYLHRVLDVCMFRVMPEPNPTATGFIDFSCSASISPIVSEAIQ